jgi:hypothetical protein
LPHKRYTQPQVFQKAEEHLDRQDARYADAAGEQGRPLFYDQASNAHNKDPAPALAASTLWRWLAWMANLPTLVREASALIRQKDADSQVHRSTWMAPPKKFRSPPRQQALQNARQLLFVRQQFDRLFGEEKFPHFAIACSWR